jgi:hypothetical protein
MVLKTDAPTEKKNHQRLKTDAATLIYLQIEVKKIGRKA